MRLYLQLPFLAMACVFLSSCGGGGNGGTSSPTTDIPDPPTASDPDPDPVINYDTAEYRRNYGLGAVNSITAYEAGLSGDGVTVATVDTGIDLKQQDLDANISRKSIDLQSNTYDGVQDEYGHGTWVAGIIAAEKNNVGIHGVAFNAQVMAIRADKHSDCTDGCSFSDSDVARGIDYAVANGAKVINLSLGSDRTINPASGLGQSLIHAVDAGLVVVIAAGNGDDNEIGMAEPDGFAQFAANPDVKGGIIIAGAVDSANQMASFSNKAGTGETQDVYMVAPGEHILTTDLTTSDEDRNQLAMIYGTSAAAPYIAAAAAILLEKFPNLDNRQVVQILLDSAKDLGAAGPDEEFGQGLLDIAAAIQPSGTLQISSAGGQSMALQGSLLTSPAMGGGLATAAGRALAFDRYDRAYNASLASRFQAPASRFSLAQAADRMNRISSSLSMGDHGLRLGISATDTGRYHASTSLEIQARDGNERSDMTIEAAITPRLSFSMQSGSTAGRTAATGDLALTARAMDPASQLSASGQRAGLTFALTRHLDVGTVAFMGDRPKADDLDPTLDDPRQSGGALTLRRWLGRTAHLDLEAGRMFERGSTLGLTGSGIFNGIEGAATDYIRFGGGVAVGSLRLDGAYMASRTGTELNGGSVFAGFDTLKANGWSLSLTDQRFASRGHVFGLHMAQPLAVTSGAATLHLATGWQDSAPVYTDQRADLSATERETSFELFHRYAASDTLSLQTNFIYRRNPDNLARSGDEAAVFLHLATAL